MITEKIMTHGRQYAKTEFEVDMDGEGSVRCDFAVGGKDDSSQLFVSKNKWNNKCADYRL